MGAREADPVLSFQFSVEMHSDPFGFIPFMIPIKGYFTEISGLDVEYEYAEYKSVNLLGWPRSNFVPLRPKYSPLVLKRGVTTTESFWLWHQLIVLGTKAIMKPYVTITMYDRSYRPLAEWHAESAWPIKVSGPQIRSDSNDVGIEELTLVHTGLHRSYLAPELAILDTMIQLVLP
jgi:phage tail-like protein